MGLAFRDLFYIFGFWGHWGQLLGLWCHWGHLLVPTPGSARVGRGHVLDMTVFVTNVIFTKKPKSTFSYLIFLKV